MIVFYAADGRTLTMEDLRGLNGAFRYEILGHSDVPAEADVLHQQARQAGGEGDYKKAISLLERVSNLAPQWPYPVYDMAFTYLLLKDAENARKYYRKTVELAPAGSSQRSPRWTRSLGKKRANCRPGPIWRTSRWSGWTTPERRLRRCGSWSSGFRALRRPVRNSRSSPTTMRRSSRPSRRDWPPIPTPRRREFCKSTGPILDRKGDHDGAVRDAGRGRPRPRLDVCD